ncbi:MBL fold metallo-hydrolase [Thalassolituus sp.]|uniref:MBL fold metallo-hydrolase n=1 Tax=Thalassolituus sp. TaxID=2030822 RepID=UPI0035115FB0
MRFRSLGSGSRGNATLVEYQSDALLIDSGFSRKVMLQRLDEAGLEPQLLRAALVTHEHSDHAKGIQSLCEHLNIPFYASFGTARKMDWTGHALWRCLVSDQAVDIGGMQVTPVVVPHDAHEPLQFVIQSAEGRRLGILSDLGTLTPHILNHYSNCHALQVEANHDPVMLANGPYPPSLRARVAGAYGHLSNEQCAEFIRSVKWPGLKYVTAGHISEKNNDRNLVARVLAEAIGCSPHEVSLLAQDEMSDWVALND